MQFSQSDLFWGMSRDFVTSTTDLAKHITCREGDKLFDIGDPADRFYVLLKGSVTMRRGDGKLHTADKAGEISMPPSRPAFQPARKGGPSSGRQNRRSSEKAAES